MTSNIQIIFDKLLYTKFGQLLLSAIFGLGLALLFKRVCKNNCIEYNAPYITEIKGKTFKLEDTCFEYIPYAVKCENAQRVLYPYDVNIEPSNKIHIESFISQN